MRFNFGAIVVVDEDQIGVVVKCWEHTEDNTASYDVYVRSYNSIKCYFDREVKQYIYDKELRKDDD